LARPVSKQGDPSVRYRDECSEGVEGAQWVSGVLDVQ
jgi:hypothetical protein